MTLYEIKEDLRPYFDGKFESEDVFEKFCSIVNDHIMGGKAYINIDLHDITTIISRADEVDIATATGAKSEIEPMLDALHKSIVEKHPGKTHATLLLHLQFSENSNFTIKDTEGISSFMGSLDPDMDCIWGIGIDDSLGKDVRLTILEGYND